ncbi:uncharacterized protein CLUP02_10820 [Colletotrichum lupini]|uniref:Uncharacterized protein n=1 Tax=Colletotrichum lupini TaxID=145971 RepID=A0A9Q8SY16_9PEZI|nr:uncharacterized protein CLUP02_10820 [Colletotrichum lupini]UQC85323.1 hypothetical protein CLUP02_10820 [Colletotrichum lupini]
MGDVDSTSKLFKDRAPKPAPCVLLANPNLPLPQDAVPLSPYFTQVEVDYWSTRSTYLDLVLHRQDLWLMEQNSNSLGFNDVQKFEALKETSHEATWFEDAGGCFANKHLRIDLWPAVFPLMSGGDDHFDARQGARRVAAFGVGSLSGDLNQRHEAQLPTVRHISRDERLSQNSKVAVSPLMVRTITDLFRAPTLFLSLIFWADCTRLNGHHSLHTAHSQKDPTNVAKFICHWIFQFVIHDLKRNSINTSTPNSFERSQILALDEGIQRIGRSAPEGPKRSWKFMKRVDHWLIPTHVFSTVLYPYLSSQFAPGKRLQHLEGLRVKEPLGLHDKMAFEAPQSSARTSILPSSLSVLPCLPGDWFDTSISQQKALFYKMNIGYSQCLCLFSSVFICHQLFQPRHLRQVFDLKSSETSPQDTRTLPTSLKRLVHNTQSFISQLDLLKIALDRNVTRDVLCFPGLLRRRILNLRRGIIRLSIPLNLSWRTLHSEAALPTSAL